MAPGSLGPCPCTKHGPFKPLVYQTGIVAETRCGSTIYSAWDGRIPEMNDLKPRSPEKRFRARILIPDKAAVRSSPQITQPAGQSRVLSRSMQRDILPSWVDASLCLQSHKSHMGTGVSDNKVASSTRVKGEQSIPAFKSLEQQEASNV